MNGPLVDWSIGPLVDEGESLAKNGYFMDLGD
jgi:hypothetical protein